MIKTRSVFVDTCHYHAQGGYCNAAIIEIQPRNAQGAEETDCAAFIHKQQMT